MIGWAIVMGLGAAAVAKGLLPTAKSSDDKPPGKSKAKKRETAAEAYARGVREATDKSEAAAAEQKKFDAAVQRAVKSQTQTSSKDDESDAE